MKINPLFEYQKLIRETSETGIRHYREPNGNMIPSVTTILSSTADKSGLKKWQDRVGLSEANRIRDESAGLGSLMHDHLEKFIKGEDRPSGSNLVRRLAKDMSDQIIQKGLVKVDEVWGTEISLYCTGVYGGTTDTAGLYNGCQAIADFKSANKMKKREYIEDYFLQLVAYGTGHDELYSTNIKTGVIFMVDRDLKFQEFVIEGNEYEATRDRWFRRVEQYYDV